ncbi:MAG: DUF1844 domain-containing protein, partial [Deltaproteobacteria bacterium]|nr:DUF1844 domain-containing protein [Deltaproteobacteria bacterium]
RQAAENRAGSQFGEQIVDGSAAGSAAGSEAAKANRESVGLGSLTPTFSTLVLALATSVMISLGEHVPEAGEPPRVDLPQAKHTIDMLGVLEEKTRGNLDETEDQLLKTLLYDLRIKYVTLIKK